MECVEILSQNEAIGAELANRDPGGVHIRIVLPNRLQQSVVGFRLTRKFVLG